MSTKRAHQLNLSIDTGMIELTGWGASRKRHRDRYARFTAKEWAQIQNIIDTGEVLPPKGHEKRGTEGHRVIYKNINGAPWLVVIIQDAKGLLKELVLSSYRRATRDEIERRKV